MRTSKTDFIKSDENIEKYITALIFKVGKNLSKEDKEDVKQDVLIALYRVKDNLKTENSYILLSYIKKITINKVLDYFDKNTKLFNLIDESIRVDDSDKFIIAYTVFNTEDDLNLSESLAKVKRILTKTDYYIWFSHCIGFSNDEIAESLDTTYHYITNRLVKIRLKLKEGLEN